jgi:hypothetical protein
MVERVGQKVYPERMKSLRLVLFVWLSLALSGSGWAFVPTNCGTTGHSHGAAAEVASPDSAASHGEHHGHHAGGAKVSDSDSVPACECCDACMTSCAFSASTMTAQVSSQLPIFDAAIVGIGQTTQHAPPPAYPLLRPPISTV